MPSNKKSLPARWNAIALEAIRRTGVPPPVAARALALLHTAMYDAWACYSNNAIGTCLGDRLSRPVEERTSDNKEKAISYAAHWTLKSLFLNKLKAEHQSMFEDMMLALGYDPYDATESFENPVGIGNLTARLVFDSRKGDGANQAAGYEDYTGFEPLFHHDDEVPENRSDKWVPILVGKEGGLSEQQFLLPHWGLVRPFALPNGSWFRPIVPPSPWNAVTLQEECEQVIRYSGGLTDKQKVIAEYWKDGPLSETPPGHWCLFAQYISERDEHGLGKDVKLFFALSNALFDAGIAAWDSKYHYYYVRPITLIRRRYAGKKINAWGGPGKGTIKMDGKDWRPYQPIESLSPPFAEFVSGHSTFSAAAAEMLRLFTRSDRFGMSYQTTTLYIDRRELAEPVELHWNTFSQAAEEAGISRIYGGIHFEEGNEKGLDMGKKVARKVWEKCALLWDGK